MSRPFPYWVGFVGLLSLLLHAEGLTQEQELPALTRPDLPVTRGLIRWWPNLFDARDEVTGQEGLVMGLLPPVETGQEDQTEFSRRTAWVQLQPAITNDVFTLAFWVICRVNRPQTSERLLAQESREGEWIFQTDRGAFDFSIGGDQSSDRNWSEFAQLEPEVWQHVLITRRADQTSAIWIDGKLARDGRVPHVWPRSSRWLVVGNGLRGGWEFHGGMRDLCAYDRVLTGQEIGALHAAGLSQRPARNTAARLAATVKPIPNQVWTNQSGSSGRSWMHRRFTIEDGLPGNVVKAVLQGRDGYLWVGTEDGLARFDGRTFRCFTSENTPALKAIGQTVWSLAEDGNGTIWAGLFGGLLRIRGLEFTAFTNGLPQRFVLQAQPAGDGSIWIAGFKNSLPRGPCWLRRYDPETGHSSAEVIVPGHLRRMILETNGLWLATEQPQQVHYWDGHAAATRVVALVDDQAPAVQLGSDQLPPGIAIRAWKQESATHSWWTEIRLGSKETVLWWHWDSRFTRPWAARWAGPASSDARWMGVSFGLARLDDGKMEKVEIPDSLADPDISCLCANREGGVWFGTEEDGLHFVQERLIRVFTTQDGLSGNDVRSVCAAADGTLWAATSEGLDSWQGGRWTMRERGRLRTVIADSQGQPWFGAAERGQLALRRLDSASTYVNLGLEWQDPNSLHFGRDGTLWVVCERGLTWLKPRQLVLGTPPAWCPDPASAQDAFGRYAIGQQLPNLLPLGLVEDLDGSLWMGSLEQGLFHIKNGTIQGYTVKDGLPSNRSVPVLLDPAGALWIVTANGLARRRGGVFESLGSQQGLPNDVLLDLVEDDLGNFWMSGKRGIHRVARTEIEDCLAGRLPRVQSLTLGAHDGLLTPECSSRSYPAIATTPNGDIWVATRYGLARFDPHRVRLDTQPLPVILEQVVANRREMSFASSFLAYSTISGGRKKPLKLPPGSGQQLEFHYTAISLAQADRVRFMHRLDGYDSEWSPGTDLRLAFYTNLRPGRYRFRVKAANTHGIWSEAETALSFVIQPFFWQTRVFFISSAAALITLAAALHGRRLRAIKRSQELKHEQALMNEKIRIAADMHDELGARLTQIAILGEVAKSQDGNMFQMRSTLDRISQAAREVTSRMSDLVWATNPRNDALENLSAYLREHAASQLQDSPIQAHLEFPADLPDCHVSATFRRNLLLILKEALHNVVKHAQASQVGVQLETNDRSLVLRVQDNGRGFVSSQSTGLGNGLSNMQKRVHDLGGKWRLHSAPGRGTCLELEVPLPQNKF